MAPSGAFAGLSGQRGAEGGWSRLGSTTCWISALVTEDRVKEQGRQESGAGEVVGQAPLLEHRQHFGQLQGPPAGRDTMRDARGWWTLQQITYPPGASGSRRLYDEISWSVNDPTSTRASSSGMSPPTSTSAATASLSQPRRIAIA